jgi:CheY-like chemotaxis protein
MSVRMPRLPERPLVLVVDDDADIAESLADALTLMGFRARTAPNGAAALELLRASPEVPAAIVLDLLMPVMNGEELGRALHADGRFAAIPIVVLTGRTESTAVAEALHAEAVLKKPVHLFLLKRALSDAIERSVARAGA